MFSKAITRRGCKLIGEPFPQQAGWRERCIGRVVEIDEGELDAEWSEADRKKAGKPKTIHVHPGSINDAIGKEAFWFFWNHPVSAKANKSTRKKFRLSRKQLSIIIQRGNKSGWPRGR